MSQSCISTGLPSLDALLGDICPGIQRGGLTIIGGSSGSGKTTLCQKIASAARPVYRVGFADIDGSREDCQGVKELGW